MEILDIAGSAVTERSEAMAWSNRDGNRCDTSRPFIVQDAVIRAAIHRRVCGEYGREALGNEFPHHPLTKRVGVGIGPEVEIVDHGVEPAAPGLAKSHPIICAPAIPMHRLSAIDVSQRWRSSDEGHHPTPQREEEAGAGNEDGQCDVEDGGHPRSVSRSMDGSYGQFGEQHRRLSPKLFSGS